VLLLALQLGVRCCADEARAAETNPAFATLLLRVSSLAAEHPISLAFREAMKGSEHAAAVRGAIDAAAAEEEKAKAEQEKAAVAQKAPATKPKGKAKAGVAKEGAAKAAASSGR
jgi:DNA invertase Pin-like site-specific DNA recombinase